MRMHRLIFNPMETRKTLFLVILVWNCIGVTTGGTRANRDAFSFTQLAYNATVQEKAASGLVTSMKKMGMWLTPETQNVHFRVVENDHGFRVNKKILGNFVFLELHSHSLMIDRQVRISALSADQRKEVFCTIFVKVQDINDFEPLFPPRPYKVTIGEDTPLGTVIAQVQAVDSDRNSENTRFYYSFPDFTNNFAIDPITGDVMLTALVSHETQAVHFLRVRATDRKSALSQTAHPKETTLTITVRTANKNAPEILVSYSGSHEFSRSQDNPPLDKRVYAILKVRDPDAGRHGRISMPRITNADAGKVMQIRPSGREDEYHLIFIQDLSSLQGVLNVHLEACDLGEPSKCSSALVHVQVYDKAAFTPTFAKNATYFTVSEFSPVFTQVGFVPATTADPSKAQSLHYAIEAGNEEGTFIINENTALITTASNLNRNIRQEYTLLVSAINTKLLQGKARANTIVTISIDDANDHDPIFTQNSYQARLAENAVVGTFVISIHADDEDVGVNGSVVYSLIDAVDMPFRIDPFNGTIFTSGLLDADVISGNEFEIRVRASDRGTPFNRKSECYVIVYVTNTNDNPPIFDKVDCEVSVPVSTRTDTNVLQLGPLDIDRDSVSCSMLSGSLDMFVVDRFTCNLKTTLAFIRANVGAQMSMLIVASDGELTSSPLVVNATITSSHRITKRCRDTGALTQFAEILNNQILQTEDKKMIASANRTSLISNDNVPTFIPPATRRRVDLSEDIAVGSIVTRIRASDPDYGFSGKLWYTIISGNDNSCFVINTQNGDIKLSKPLFRELKSEHRLVVEVSDLGIPRKTNRIRVRFVIIDVNNNPPVFDSNLYTFELDENVPVGYTFQRNVRAVDIDHGSNAIVRYRLSSTARGKFSIHPVTGRINVTDTLDREETAKYTFNVIATDGALVGPLSSTTQVVIRVSDVNDNPPRFYRPMYKTRVAEDLPVGSVIYWLQAHDPDYKENGIVRYSLTNGLSDKRDHSPKFSVDTRTGAIRLAAKLDFRKQNRYNITARARDLHQRVSDEFGICYVEVEVMAVNRNLYAPYFDDRYIRIKIAEGTSIGTPIHTLSATDEDTTDPEGDVGYSIVDGTGLGVFAINENTGTITTMQSLDRETVQFYWLTVVAKDRAAFPLFGHVFTLVEVTDVNDNAPYTSKPIYFASIAENSLVETIVTHITATDHDSEASGNLTYTLAKNINLFKIDPITGIIRTKKRRIDRETTHPSNLTFEVMIVDGGTPLLSTTATVVVKITDVNDNSPKFMSDVDNKLYLPARNRTTKPVAIARVVAHDKDDGLNAKIIYKLVNNNVRFRIHPNTGVLSTKYAFSNDAHSVIKVIAYDNGTSPRHSRFKRVDITWGPPAPKSAYPPVFNDVDQHEAMYYEHVDVEFEQDASQLSDSRFILLLEASDIDSDQLWFRIVDGNEDHMFHINTQVTPYSGARGSLLLTGHPDAEKKDFYNLTIEVTDGCNSAFTAVPVRIGDVNDHRPIFNEEVYRISVRENSPASTRITKVRATDQDRSRRNKDLIYSIRGSVDPSSLAKFRITPRGFIYTTVELDREVQREHILTVGVDDQGAPGSLQAYCRVIITVEDTNEHPPRFTARNYAAIMTTANMVAQAGADDRDGKVVLRVRATDKDHGENARIVYSISNNNTDGLWRINPITGEITLAKRPLSLGATSPSSSYFTVQATDGADEPLSDTAQVMIDVRYCDDAEPRFFTDHLTVSLLENTPPKSFVTMVEASAPSSVTYNVTSEHGDKTFIINPHSGVVSLVESLDRETRSSYSLIVTAVSAEGKYSTARLVINVKDTNDNRPEFGTLLYVGKVLEHRGSSASSSVNDDNDLPLVVNAIDADVGDNARVSYRIVEASEEVSQRFAIDANTGALRTLSGIGLFDYEAVKEYSFQVQAFDLGSPRQVSVKNAVVKIQVKDADDYIPVFTNAHYHFQLMLPTCEGVVVSRETRVSDMNSSSLHPQMMTYSISGGNERSAFEIDSHTGSLYVADASVLNAGDDFALRVRVSDGKKLAVAVVSIAVIDMPQEHHLTFTRGVYHAVVQENLSEPKDLTVVSTLGVDLADYVRFTILNPFPAFTIGSSGVVSTTGIPVDREERAVYELLVEAITVHPVKGQIQPEIRRGRTIVRVKVKDVNDNSPQFLQVPYYATLQVEAAPGTVVKKVQAVDADAGKNKEVQYRLKGEHVHFFEIGLRDGVIRVRRTPADTIGRSSIQFNLTILAIDMGNPSLVGRTMLRLSLVNRATPVFTQPFYRELEIPENAQAHTVITTDVRASSPEGADVFYTIEDGDPLHQFDIDFVTGTVSSLGKLDYEIKNQYQLLVRARDAHSRAYADVKVTIDVTDANDNSPIFLEPSYVGRLLETARVGSVVVKVNASDIDSAANSRIRYSMVSNASSHVNSFLLDPDTGIVWIASSLDHELLPTLSFVIRAADSGVPMRYSDVAVTLFVDDVNDNSPVFDKKTYEFYVSVDVSPGTFVGKVNAWDPDTSNSGGLMYSIQHSLFSHFLVIDQSTGIVSLSDSATLTPDLLAIHANVTVTDNVFTSTARLIIHIKVADTSPAPVIFDSAVYNMNVVENKAAGIKIGTVKAIGRGTLRYSMDVEAFYSDFFRVDSSTGEIFTEMLIDREYLPKKVSVDDVLTFHITATDNRGSIGRCVVRAHVIDINDNFPIFTQDNYSAVVVLGQSSIGDHVITVLAHDADKNDNGTVKYSWDEDPFGAKMFLHLDTDTGDITIQRLGNIRNLDFYVRASDGGSPVAESSVVGVAVNFASDSDPIPRFERKKWRVSVPENVNVGSKVTRVHATADQIRITYALAKPYITDKEYETLSDDDATAKQQPFDIDPVTGDVTTSRVLDREDQPSYVITVLAFAETTPHLVASAEIHVAVEDIDDNKPEFMAEKYHCSIVENSPGNDLVQVKAIDQDEDLFGDVTYSLVVPDGVSNFAFTIGNKTGILRSLTPFDREVTDSYSVTVQATSGSQNVNQLFTARSMVVVHIIDINDNLPTFSQSQFSVFISESVPVGHVTSRFVHVTDNDTASGSSLYLHITEGDPQRIFAVDWERSALNDNSITAGLRILKKLDRETQAMYDLTLLATDGLHISTTRVRISVGDINDNAPVCGQLSYRASVSEDATKNTLILHLTSYDADASGYGTVKYTLTGEGSESFYLDSVSGQLFTLETLDYEETQEYILQAISTDEGGLTCTSEVLVTVQDVNDNPPHFMTSSLRASARENTPVNSLLYRVIAGDRDQGENGTVSFGLIDDLNGQFYLEPYSGVIILKKPLDRETVPFYELEVVATDHGKEKRLSANALLYLQVLDVNDNPPIFTQTQYEELVREDAIPGDVVGQVEAKSLDAGANSKLRFSITHGNEHEKFYINQNTGEVTLASVVDFEINQSYMLTITASDRSERPLSSDCTLHIVITDVNDNPPRFTSLTDLVSIPEDVEVGRVIHVFTAIDHDSGLDGNVTYSLQSDSKIPFEIDSVTGEFLVAPPGVDYELQKSYQVVIVATDGGVPALYTKTSVLVNIQDINDNRPSFIVTMPVEGNSNRMSCSNGANCTVYVHESSTDSVVNGIIHLNATDADGEENTGPFRFRIVSGNNADLFYLNFDDCLKSRRPLRLSDMPTRKRRDRQMLIHQLTIEAVDSGSPIFLSSQPLLLLNIIVMKESKYAPVMKSHEIEIFTPEKEFNGGVISLGMHATDRDVFDEDRLRFSLATPEDFENFVIHPVTGSITAETPLAEGRYNVSVRVSDGSLFGSSTLPIIVRRVTTQALENSVSISFRGISGTKEYLLRYHDLFVDKLSEILPNGFEPNRDLLTLSLQAIDDVVEMLFAISKPPSRKTLRSFYFSKSLRNVLEKSKILIEEKLRVEVYDIQGTACAAEDCQHGSCRQVPNLVSSPFLNSLVPVSTVGRSLITAPFQRTQQCVCPPGTVAPTCQSVCSDANNPCPKNLICSVDETEANGYGCNNPTSATSVMTFSGKSFVRYALMDSLQNSPFRIKFRMRTYQTNATIFYAAGRQHFARLETSNGLLRYTFDCGSGPQTMVRDVQFVNDGRWHDVDIRSSEGRSKSSCAFKLTVGKYVASAESVGGAGQLDVTTFTLGGMPDSGRLKRDAHRNKKSHLVVQHAFRGCLENVGVNEVALTSSSSSSRAVRVETQVDVASNCRNDLIDMEACTDSPCVNGGRCLPLSDGSHECDCPLNYDGDRCEISDPCGSLPCKNKGVCLSDGDNIRCQCRDGFSGSHCEIPSACLALSQCLNGGSCVESEILLPYCHCPPEWTGEHCEIDVDECTDGVGINECGSAKLCFNYEGGFFCNCSNTNGVENNLGCRENKNGEVGSVHKSSFPSYIIIIVACVVVLVITILVGVVCYRRKKGKKKYKRGSRRSKEFQSGANFSPNNCNQRSNRMMYPPRIPERPSDYQRSSRDCIDIAPVPANMENPISPISPTISASENSSIKKTSPSWQVYDPAKFDGSVTSSIRQWPSSRKASKLSFDAQQDLNWDTTDLKPNVSGIFSPEDVINDHQSRCGHYDWPSSPESRHSHISASTNRSRRTHRSDALPGYYSSSARKRKEKQFRMLDSNPDFQSMERRHRQAQPYVYHQKFGAELPFQSRNSRESTMRSSSSKYQSSLRRYDSLPRSPSNHMMSPSFPNSVNASYPNSNDEYEDENIKDVDCNTPSAGITSDEREFSTSSGRPNSSDSDSEPRSSSASERLPPPPSDFELRTLHEEVVDNEIMYDPSPSSPASSSYSSLLVSSFNLDMPTPAAARKKKFHPDQYLIPYPDQTEDFSDQYELTPRSSYSLDLSSEPSRYRSQGPPYQSSHHVTNTTPAPPVRSDSVRLELSSLSEADDDDEFVSGKRHINNKADHHGYGRPPIDRKHRHRHRNHRERAANKRGCTEATSSREKQPLHFQGVE